MNQEYLEAMALTLLGRGAGVHPLPHAKFATDAVVGWPESNPDLPLVAFRRDGKTIASVAFTVSVLPPIQKANDSQAPKENGQTGGPDKGEAPPADSRSKRSKNPRNPRARGPNNAENQRHQSGPLRDSSSSWMRRRRRLALKFLIDILDITRSLDPEEAAEIIEFFVDRQADEEMIDDREHDALVRFLGEFLFFEEAK